MGLPLRKEVGNCEKLMPLIIKLITFNCKGVVTNDHSHSHTISSVGPYKVEETREKLDERGPCYSGTGKTMMDDFVWVI